MKLAISHIAWPLEKEHFYLDQVKLWGCSGIELAPSRIWDEPIDTNKEDRKRYLRLISSKNLDIPAIQSLLFTRPDLILFKDKKTDDNIVEYLKSLCRVGADLGAKVLVFGSPRNRNKGHLELDMAFADAANIFSKVSRFAENLNVTICIEPLSPTVTDFINTLEEGYKLVNMVGRPGFGLHIDAAALSNEEVTMRHYQIFASKAHHFHISEPGLVEINGTTKVKHNLYARILKEVGYQNYVSIEMRMAAGYHETIKRSISFSKNIYSHSLENVLN